VTNGNINILEEQVTSVNINLQFHLDYDPLVTALSIDC